MSFETLYSLPILNSNTLLPSKLFTRTFSFSLVKTAGTEELGNSEQTYQGWLYLLVLAFSSCWYSCFGHCHILVDQISVDNDTGISVKPT